ncbi:MarR family winged helix-turn-helix transcriptional regulator [Nisaea nitritireducens]|uniref:MarR family winged helix-turn-helix transcriptional regulator n=1 Tax=Nisaea nitritireducens TaxID=568392 RepID=UPI001867E5D8|nr:MarR family transcriptional regulator [Nisaea nitritireducens]
MTVDATDVPGPYHLEDQIGFMLRLANQRHMAIFTEMMGGELTAVQFSTLVRLSEVDGPISQNALGRLVGMDAATTKGVLARLMARDLVKMEKSQTDKRRYMLSTTQAGRDLIAKLVPVARQITEETLAPLNAKERASLLRLLAKLY